MLEKNSINIQNLHDFGHDKLQVVLPDTLKELILEQKWQQLDYALADLIAPAGIVRRLLDQYMTFSRIEYITNVREAKNEWEEDGIWHDDGSRVLAFSLSLNFHPEAIEGGVLGFRKKGEAKEIQLSVQPYGTLLVFATGNWGWEHKVYKLSKGTRVVMAGWCD